MKVKCSQKALANALNIVNKAVSPNNTLPVLNNILINVEGKKITFSATNLEIAVKTVIDADVINEGSVTIPSKIFSSYVSLLKDGDVELKLEDGMSLSVKASHSETKIKGISADEFPLIPKIEDALTYEIPVDSFRESIDQVAFAASTNAVRPVLTGVLFRFKKNELRMVATDSYRLSEKVLKLNTDVVEERDCIIPARTVMELGKIISSQKGNIEVRVANNQVMFKAGDTVLISRLIEGHFPDYEKILPKESKTQCEVVVEDLVLAVKKVNLFVMETNNNVKISVTNDGTLVVATDETQVGEGRADVEVKIKGDNNKVALNAQYILDVLSSLHEEKVVLEMVDKINPVMIKPLKKTEYVHIIMPLKL